MTFNEIVEQQWSDYEARHRHKTHLILKMVGVALAWLSSIQAAGGMFLMLLPRVPGFGTLVWALVMLAVAVFLQYHGSTMEAAGPARRPLLTKDYALWLLADNVVNFPRFVLTGGWLKNLQAAG